MAQKPRLGCSYSKEGTTFRLYSETAKRIQLCLFSEDEKLEIQVEMKKDENNYWAATVESIKIGQKYGYRAHGEFAPERGLYFDANKLLIDPYAHEISKSFDEIWQDDRLKTSHHEDNATIMPKSVVVENNSEKDAQLFPYLKKKPSFYKGKTSIYETNIKSFSKIDKAIPEESRGKFAAFRNPEIIAYFQDLGFNEIEFLPSLINCTDRRLKAFEGKIDAWGYNTVGLAINPRYGNLNSLKATINELHKNDIKVCLDVVFNHSGEYEAQGNSANTLSFKGIDAPSFYYLEDYDKSLFVDRTGCRNTLNLETPAGEAYFNQFIDWTVATGIDSLRFDLAGVCASNQYAQFLPEGTFVKGINRAMDMGVSIYLEPWDARGNIYKNEFAAYAPRAKCWTDERRENAGEFYSVVGGKNGALATQISGSEMINFQTGETNVVGTTMTHDGFTLADALRYGKNNWENGEENRDGSRDAFHYKSHDEKEHLTRMKSVHAFNILSKGIPLTYGGDELARTQKGNNNPYCIDNEGVYHNWEKWNKNELSSDEKELYLFVRRLNALRQTHPALNNLHTFTDKICEENGRKEVEWMRPDGTEMEGHDWNVGHARTLAYVMNGKASGDEADFMVLTSGDFSSVDYKLPQPPSGEKWHVVFDSADVSADKKEYEKDSAYQLKPFSYVLLSSQHNKTYVNKRTANDISSVLSGLLAARSKSK
ncbi:MAG: alpha-amylase family glycosyl hydrolase [Alphaproteobacteria bacterium]|nr:alpha-amylase family glycosyl hydrolase [Alphaproteobacteria bacterium]